MIWQLLYALAELFYVNSNQHCLHSTAILALPYSTAILALHMVASP
jgi:hypothetical protein